MSTTTMQFGPEWMRAKKIQNPPSPPSTYSSLVSSMPPTSLEKRDDPNPFRYSKEELLKIYKDGNYKGGLDLEVERWEGVVREVPTEPIGLREMGEVEKKTFSGSLNSDLRRRQQSGDYLAPLTTSIDRSRLNYSNANSPLRERFGTVRRRDSTADSPAGLPPMPRKQSISSLQTSGMSHRDVGLPSPRSRVGLTSNFDGVLNSNGGESWGARRRPSEASLKGAMPMSREASSDLQIDGRTKEIREEIEEHDTMNSLARKLLDRERSGRQQVQANPEETGGISPMEAGPHGVVLHANSSKPDLGGATNSQLTGLQDPSTVEWSYKDPTGQIQGPFRAHVMQKWYDEGYFTPDLPMKRTYLDTQWTTVQDLTRRSSSDKIFLTPALPTGPPGLTRRNDLTLHPLSATEHSILPGLINQPSPIRTLRSSTLDNYPASSSDSHSSFAGTRYNDSPDSSGLGGRPNNSTYFGEPFMNGRIASFIGAEASAPFPGRRATYGDALDSTLVRSPGYSSGAPSRTASIGDYSNNGIYNPGLYTQAFDSMPQRSVEQASLNAYNHSPGIEQGLNYHHLRNGRESGFREGILGSGALNQSDSSTNSGHRPGTVNENGAPFDQYNNFGPAINDAAHFSQKDSNFLSHPKAQFPVASLGAVDQNLANVLHSLDLQTSHIKNSDPESLVSPPRQDISNQSALRNGGALDPLHHHGSSLAALPATTSQASPWSNKPGSSQQLTHSRQVSPWSFPTAVAKASQDEPHHDQLTVSNVVQHNQQYQSNESQSSKTSLPESLNRHAEPPNVVPTSMSPMQETSILSSDLVPASRTKVTTKPDEEPKSAKLITTDIADSPIKPDAPTPVLPSKTAWAKDEDAKKLASSISLRQIQEAEVKKSEARKAAERTIKVTASTSPESKEDRQQVTTSWGLSTSHSGARLPTLSKEANATPTPSSPSAPAPVWTAAVKTTATKKSMKEIQEEEQRKKLSAAKEATAATAARRASTEPMNKAPVNQGGAWALVGANGKMSTPAAVLSKPSAGSTSSVIQVPPRSNGPATTKLSAVPIKPSIPTPPKLADDFPPAPSHDFLRWLTESLKGLNNSVNVEEIMSMLLSFPLDPDPSTVELISDLIYTNSTTLDGRRFAAEFVNKRKSDAASRIKSPGASGKIPAKPVSIADVVKTAPKPAQPEWAFKVVNKKKKAGRT